jgi:hypothetical protein
MVHLPISGPEGGLARLAKLRRAQRVFVHINNINPIILDEDSHSIERFGKQIGRLRRTDGNSGCAERSRLSPLDQE